jgi:Mrp family chromosome partitioning ATPase
MTDDARHAATHHHPGWRPACRVPATRRTQFPPLQPQLAPLFSTAFRKPMSQIAEQLDRSGATAFVHPKHPRSICIINYKGGVGKTTITALLGLYLAQVAKKKVLLFDIDAQCSLSLALGFDPEKVSKTDLTVYNLVEPKAWTKLKQKKLENYAQPLKSSFLPRNIEIIPGSFNTDELD